MSQAFLNTQFNLDWGKIHASLGTGWIPDISLWNTGKPLVDQAGKQYVLAETVPYSPGYSPAISHAYSNGLTTYAIIDTGQCQVSVIGGVNAHPTDTLYFQIINDDVLVPDGPLGGLLLAVVPVPPNTAFSYSIPIICLDGMLIGLSTTLVTKTTPAGSYFFYSCLFRSAA